MNNFDVFLTNYSDLIKETSPYTYINYPLSDRDISRVSLAINGFEDKKVLLSTIKPNLFFNGTVKNKSELFKYIFSLIRKEFGTNLPLEDSIIQREYIGDTYFGNDIALPHPLSPISDETFISVSVLDEPIKWSENSYVRLVILVSIEKGVPKAFQLWHYLSN